VSGRPDHARHEPRAFDKEPARTRHGRRRRCVPAATAHAQSGPTLATAALPLSSLPEGGKLAAQGYVAKGSLGAGVRAAYDRVVMFHSAGSIIFFDERLLETESAAAAKADLTTLRRSFTPAKFAAWDGSIHDLYLASVLLPVDSRLGGAGTVRSALRGGWSPSRRPPCRLPSGRRR
jgi:hypothetical protein